MEAAGVTCEVHHHHMYLLIKIGIHNQTVLDAMVYDVAVSSTKRSWRHCLRVIT